MTKKPTTYVLSITDMSGSMHHLADDVRGGYNTWIESLRADTDARYRVTVVNFDDRYEVLAVNAKLKDVPAYTTANYMPRGSTALRDAIGRTILDFEKAVPVLGDDDRVLLVVQTDGKENASREYTATAIADMISEREKGGKWKCLYLGAHPDAWDQSSTLGFARGSTMTVGATGQGVSNTYRGLSEGTRSYAAGEDGDAVAVAVASAASVDPDDLTAVDTTS
jgi:hypothetical protein